jgi:hypothetical protein
MFLISFEEVITPTKLFIDLRDYFFAGTDNRAEKIIELFLTWIQYNPSSISEV